MKSLRGRGRRKRRGEERDCAARLETNLMCVSYAIHFRPPYNNPPSETLMTEGLPYSRFMLLLNDFM
jgi:hypothetical protein